MNHVREERKNWIEWGISALNPFSLSISISWRRRRHFPIKDVTYDVIEWWMWQRYKKERECVCENGRAVNFYGNSMNAWTHTRRFPSFYRRQLFANPFLRAENDLFAECHMKCIYCLWLDEYDGFYGIENCFLKY